MGFWEPLLFWMLALGAVGTSIALLAFRNPLYSALALVADFFCFAALYGLLSAHFLAIIQILVYAGAIMVLFVFIIMLLNLSDEELGARRFHLHHALAVVAGVFIFVAAVGTFVSAVGTDGVAQNREAAELSAHVGETAGNVAYEIARERRRRNSADREGGAETTPLTRPPAPEMFVRTPSRVPGLFADISEPALRAEYRSRIRSWEEGESTPADQKYRPFEADRTFEVPPAMRRDARAAGGEIQERDVRAQGELFGTVEPIAILLVNRFVVPFELTAVLLLAGIFGAVVIAKKRL